MLLTKRKLDLILVTEADNRMRLVDTDLRILPDANLKFIWVRDTVYGRANLPDNWFQVGLDHNEKLIGGDWVFTRAIDKPCWCLPVDTLEDVINSTGNQDVRICEIETYYGYQAALVIDSLDY